MQFNFTDKSLGKLYGDRFYIIPGDEKPVEVEEQQIEATDKEVEQVEEVIPTPVIKESSQVEEPEPVQEKPVAEIQPATSNLVWKPKENGKVLFIAHQAELKDKALGELLKNIVQSIGIPIEQAGFGIIKGDIQQNDLNSIPNPYGVLFDNDFQADENPFAAGDGSIYKSHRLSELADNADLKRQLWGQLKEIKSKL